MAVYDYATTFTGLLQEKYSKELCSDALTKSNMQVQFINAQTIKLPRMTLSGYKDHSRTPGFNSGTMSNDWEPKKLEHDRDIEFSSIRWISTKLISRFQLQIFRTHLRLSVLFPKRTVYRFLSFCGATTYGGNIDATVLTAANILDKFDDMMTAMDEAAVPEEAEFCTQLRLSS